MNKALTIILLFFSLRGTTQEFGLGISTGPVFYQINSFKNTTATSYDTEVGFNLGIEAHYYFKNSKLSAGLVLNTLTFQRAFNPITNSTVPDPSIPLFTIYENQYLDIPIYYSYAIISGNQFTLGGSAGVLASILTKSNEETTYQDLSKKTSTFSNPFLFGALVGINANYLITDHFLMKGNIVYNRWFGVFEDFMDPPSAIRPSIGFEYIF